MVKLPSTVTAISSARIDDWLMLRRQLWPNHSDQEHLAEMSSFLSQPGQFAQFMSFDAGGDPSGFAEASVRHDYVNGAETSPVAFLEGIYVEPAFRHQGVAGSLVEAVCAWARAQGLSELASDADLTNDLSHAMHLALGFRETERVVFFSRPLTADDEPQR